MVDQLSYDCRAPSSAFSTLKNAWAGKVTQRPVPRRQHTLKRERESRTLSYQNGSRVVKQNDFGIGPTWVAILAPQVLVAQLCLTLRDPMDCSPPGSSVHGILQARILEWAAMPFSRGSYQPRDRTQVSHIVGRYFTVWTTWEAKVKVAQLCLTLCDPHGLPWPRDQTQVSQIAGRFFTNWTPSVTWLYHLLLIIKESPSLTFPICRWRTLTIS